MPPFIRRRIEHRPNLLRVIDNIGWLFFDKILRIGVGLLVGVWVARYLGPEQFGLLSFVTAFVGLFGAIAGMGLQGIVVRDIVRDYACKEETLGTAATLQIMGGLLAYCLILTTILCLRPKDDLTIVLVAILGSTMLFKASEVTSYWFESQVQSKYIVWVQTSMFVVFAAIKVALIISHATLVFFVWATMAETLVVAFLMCLVFSRFGQSLRQLRFTFLRARTLLNDSWPLMLSGIAIVVYMKIDQIMLGQMVGDQAVGIYSVAVRISEIWYFIPMMIISSVSPAILASKKHSNEIYYQRLQRLYNLMVWLAVSVALPMTFLSSTIVMLLFGQGYAGSGPVLAIHIWASIFVFLGVASAQWFLAENLQAMAFQRTALGAVVNIILNFLLIPSFEEIGAAVATIISQAFAALFFDAMRPVTRSMFIMKIRAMNPLRLIDGLR